MLAYGIRLQAISWHNHTISVVSTWLSSLLFPSIPLFSHYIHVYCCYSLSHAPCLYCRFVMLTTITSLCNIFYIIIGIVCFRCLSSFNHTLYSPLLIHSPLLILFLSPYRLDLPFIFVQLNSIFDMQLIHLLPFALLPYHNSLFSSGCFTAPPQILHIHCVHLTPVLFFYNPSIRQQFIIICVVVLQIFFYFHSIGADVLIPK